jgi:hypothetical protein
MSFSFSEISLSDIKRLAIAEFTSDMAETLVAYFKTYATQGVVLVEVTNHGLWLINPDRGVRQFLGSAQKLPNDYVPIKPKRLS